MITHALTDASAEVILSNDELVLLVNALNELCNNSDVVIDDGEFQTRVGRTREEARVLLGELNHLLTRGSQP